MGPISRTTAWRVGCFWEDMDGKVKVFLEKDQQRKEVQVEIRIHGGRRMVWLEVEKTNPHKRRKKEMSNSHKEKGVQGCKKTYLKRKEP